MKQMYFMAEEIRLERLSKIGDPLDRMRTLDWEMFRETLDNAFKAEPKGPGGRPPFDRVLLFKIAMLQSWYGLSDDKAEFMINDRLSFQRFLGLDLSDRVPDAKTIWAFKEHLKKTGAYETLFRLFVDLLQSRGIVTREGSLVDASFAEAPRQRNTRDENRKIKEGEVPEEWLWEENANKLEQKDTDARWTRKHGIAYFGYKNHVKVDKTSKIIVNHLVTDAARHDSQCLEELLDEGDSDVWGDSAYVGKDIHDGIIEKYPEIKLHIIEKASRGNPLTESQKESNRDKSAVRARVEHVFGHMAQAMGGMRLRGIGLLRAKRDIALKNLSYNLQRFAYLTRPKKWIRI